MDYFDVAKLIKDFDLCKYIYTDFYMLYNIFF